MSKIAGVPVSIPPCADCGGFDYEWMHRCQEHLCWYCRGCTCPECGRESLATDDSSEEDEP